MGHIKMMAATQPFLSGAISKTVNLPQDCSVDDIAEAYIESWRQGLKAVAIYRDNSKGTQPLNVSAQTDADKKENTRHRSRPASRRLHRDRRSRHRRQGRSSRNAAQAAHHRPRSPAQGRSPKPPCRTPTPSTRSPHPAPSVTVSPPSAPRVTHKFGLAGHEGYITVGLYPNGQPGEIFIRMAKEGSTVSGLMDSFATAVSLALQHGVPLRVLCEKFAHTRFEPSGWTGNEQIGYAKSIMDYIFRWIQIRFLSGHQLDLFAGLAPQHATIPVEGTVTAPGNTRHPQPRCASDSTHPASYRRSGTCGYLTLARQTYYDRTPPQQGIAPDLSARSGLALPTPEPLLPPWKTAASTTPPTP